MLATLGVFHCTCRFHRDEEYKPAMLIPETECGYHASIEREAARYRWLRERGFAWRDCYRGDWREGEWAYAVGGADDMVDAAMKEER